MITQGITAPRDVGFVLVAFGMLEIGKIPAWIVVLAAAAGGHFF